MEVSPTVFVTDDSRMMDGVRDPTDDEVLRSAGMGAGKVRHITSDEFLKQAQEKQPPKSTAKAELDAAVEGIRRGRAAQSGLIELKPKDLPPLMEAASATWNLFQREVKETLDAKRAAFVRQLRVDKRYSWRAVARACSTAWRKDWGSNQLAGMALCEHAARHFLEDYRQPPWN